jgi:hypothetical protein
MPHTSASSPPSPGLQQNEASKPTSPPVPQRKTKKSNKSNEWKNVKVCKDVPDLLKADPRAQYNFINNASLTSVKHEQEGKKVAKYICQVLFAKELEKANWVKDGTGLLDHPTLGPWMRQVAPYVASFPPFADGAPDVSYLHLSCLSPLADSFIENPRVLDQLRSEHLV